MRRPSTPPTDSGRGHRRHIAWIAIAVALLAIVAVAVTATLTDLTGDSGSDPQTSATRPENPFEEARAQGVADALNTYSSALRAGDAPAAETVLDPSANQALRERTASSAAGLPDLPLTTFEYRLGDTGGAEQLVPAELQSRLDEQGSSDSWVAPIQLRYAYEGIDTTPVVVDMPMVMARYGDGWKIAADAGPVLGGAAPRGQVWQFAAPSARPVATAGGESLVLTNGASPLTGVVGGLLPAATESVTAFWGTKWPRTAGVIVTTGDDEFASITGASAADVEAAAAVTVFTAIDPNGPTALGQRVVFTPQAAQLDPNTLAVVLRHEVFHVAARTVTAEGAPVWVTEGVAEYVGRRGTYTRLDQAAPALAAEISSSGPPADIPSDANFAPSSPDAALAYQSAWSVAAFIADTFGDDKLKRFYVALAGADQPVDPALITASQDTASKVVLGVSRDDLVRQWRAWLSRHD